MIELLTVAIHNAMPGLTVIGAALYVRRRVDQCEARFARDLERVLAALAHSSSGRMVDGLNGTAVPQVTVEALPSPLPVARVHKA
jgi:hypothetical protein